MDNSPKNVMAGWRESIELCPFLDAQPDHGEHQSYQIDHTKWNTMMSQPQPWRMVVIAAKNSMTLRVDRSRQFSTWTPYSTNIFYRLINDDAHNLRGAGYVAGSQAFAKAGEAILKPKTVDGGNAQHQQAGHLLNLKARRKWMWTATPLVNQIQDLRWVCRFL